MFFIYFLILLFGSIHGHHHHHHQRTHGWAPNKKIYSYYPDNAFDAIEPDFTPRGQTPGLSIIKHESSSDWNHEGQDKWGDKEPQCNGYRQSPINIDTSTVYQLEPRLWCLKWFNYDSHYNMTLQNTGHSIDVSSTWDSGIIPSIAGGILDGPYIFHSLHFHWGGDDSRGSEHTIDDESFVLEMHLIHYNSKFSNLQDAVKSNEIDSLAVVGILFKKGEESNPGINFIARAMEKAKNNGVQTFPLPLYLFGVNFPNHYYTYQGSLTTPACNEIVRWMVSWDIQEISSQDLKVFRQVRVNGEPLVNNYRRVQPLNGRDVYFADFCVPE